VCLLLSEGCIEFGRLDYTRPSALQGDDYNPWYNFKHPEVFSVTPHVSVSTNADSTTYLFCPFPCPLPLIPWIPGIISSWFYSHDYEPEQRLWIELWFMPDDIQITFDVHKVIVQTSDEKQYSPAGLEGPAILQERQANQNKNVLYVSHSCSLPLQLGNNYVRGHIPDHEIDTTNPICIRLAFPVSVTPATSYLLRIDGISEGGVPLSIPPIKFDRVSRKQIWRTL
jgi:hypothetical protein